jgi:hypothetical protein
LHGSRACLGSLVESAIVAVAGARLASRRRWRTAGTLLASSIGARLTVPDTGAAIGVGVLADRGRL